MLPEQKIAELIRKGQVEASQKKTIEDYIEVVAKTVLLAERHGREEGLSEGSRARMVAVFAMECAADARERRAAIYGAEGKLQRQVVVFK